MNNNQSSSSLSPANSIDRYNPNPIQGEESYMSSHSSAFADSSQNQSSQEQYEDSSKAKNIKIQSVFSGYKERQKGPTIQKQKEENGSQNNLEGNSGGEDSIISQEEAADKKIIQDTNGVIGEGEEPYMSSHSSAFCNSSQNQSSQEQYEYFGKAKNIKTQSVFRRNEARKEIKDRLIGNNNELYESIRHECRYYFRKNEKEDLRLTTEFANANKDNTGKELYEAFEKQINQYRKQNAEYIIKAIINERDYIKESKKNSKETNSSQYETDYKEKFKADDNDIIDRGIRMIAAGRLTKELADCGKIHPAHKIPMDDKFEGYIKKHFNRFLIQMQKDPEDIKTNGQLHTFVYYRKHFLDNLLSAVKEKSETNQDFDDKVNMIYVMLDEMAEDADLKHEMEAFLGGTLKDALHKKIDKLPEYKDQNSTIDTNSQSTNSQSSQSNLSYGEDQDAKSSQPQVISHSSNRQSLEGLRSFNGRNVYLENNVALKQQRKSGKIANKSQSIDIGNKTF